MLTVTCWNDECPSPDVQLMGAVSSLLIGAQKFQCPACKCKVVIAIEPIKGVPDAA